MRFAAMILGSVGGLLAFSVALFDLAMARSDALALLLLLAGALGMAGAFWLTDEEAEGPVLILIAAAASLAASFVIGELALLAALLLLASAALAWFAGSRRLARPR